MKSRSLFAEALGTALLVFFGAGTATLTFGFKITGASVSAGVVATALAFGLVLLVLVYGIGPISGCHVNPAVTIGFLAARRITLADALGYWVAQVAGGIAGAAGLFGLLHLSSGYQASLVSAPTGTGRHQ
jgi:aquaporin Z